MIIGPFRLHADAIVTGGADAIRSGAAIDVGADGRITAIGRVADLPRPPGRQLWMGGLVMPGLVNIHCHTPMTLLRSIGDGLPLKRWLTEAVWPREAKMSEEDAWWGMALGSAEMLRAGVTTSCEMYMFEAAILDAVSHSGARLVLTPAVLSALHGSERIEEIVDLHDRHHDPNGRTTVGFGPHSLYDLGIDRIVELAEAARDIDALVHMHLEETRAERSEVMERHGRSATRVLADAGVLGGRFLGAHGVWLDEEDRRLLGEHGAAVAHCPQSNLKLGSGIAPLLEHRAAGIVVGLGTDGPASNDDLDLWEEMRLAPLLARGMSGDPSVMTAGEALALATSEGASALGMTDVGVLRPGAWADMIRLDLDQPAFVPSITDDTVLAHLVWAASSRLVTDVWVAGRRVVDDGRCITIDEDEARVEVATRARRLEE